MGPLKHFRWIQQQCSQALVCLCFLFKALPDEQRHHVCEGARSLGHTLQICRADEHQDAFQVAATVTTSSFSQAGNFAESLRSQYTNLLFLPLIKGKNVTTQTGRAKPWAGKWILGFGDVFVWARAARCIDVRNAIYERRSCGASAVKWAADGVLRLKLSVTSAASADRGTSS